MEKYVQSSNILLLKDDVGKGKPATMKLPPQGHTYGKPDNRDTEGASKVTSSWQTHTQSQGNKPPTDFRKLNKKIAPPLMRGTVSLTF